MPAQTNTSSGEGEPEDHPLGAQLSRNFKTVAKTHIGPNVIDEPASPLETGATRGGQTEELPLTCRAPRRDQGGSVGRHRVMGRPLESRKNRTNDPGTAGCLVSDGRRFRRNVDPRTWLERLEAALRSGRARPTPGPRTVAPGGFGTQGAVRAEQSAAFAQPTHFDVAQRPDGAQ